MDGFMIGFVLLFISMIVSRAISSRAYRKLEPEKKVALVELFSKGGITSGLIIAGFMVMFFLNLKYNIIDLEIASLIYFGLVLVFLLFAGYNSYKKLVLNDFPKDYIRQFLIATTIRFIGIILFLVFMQALLTPVHPLV